MQKSLNFKNLICTLFFGILLTGSLCACGLSGVYVNMGSHEEQDEVMYEILKEQYPRMEFACESSETRNVHNVIASDGTEFAVWVMALRKGEWQVDEHYPEEWLIQKGWYSSVEERLENTGMSAKFFTMNYYPHNFAIECGELTEERFEEVMKTIYAAKAEFDDLMLEFMDATGAEELPGVYVFVRFTKDGVDKSELLPMGSTNAIYTSFGPYDYEGYFRHYIE